MKYQGPLDERELVAKIKDYIDAAETHIDSEIAAERVQGYKYYYGRPFGNERSGRSQHVSRDVFDAVEHVKSLLLQTFNASESVVRFEPRDEDDVAAADQATRYVNRVFYKDNDGYRALHDLIHDGLVAKLGVCSVYWNQQIDRIPERLENVTLEQLDLLLAEPDFELDDEVEVIEVQDEMGNVVQQVSANVVRIEDNSHVEVDVIPPERFYVDPEADDLSTARFTANLTYMTRGELKDMGVDEETLDGLMPERDSYNDWEEQTRERQSLRLNEQYEYYSLYEVYIKCDIEGGGSENMYQVLIVGDEILSIEMVDKHPFYAFSPFPIPHQVYGLSMADILADVQKSRSTLQRLIIDNQAMANTSRTVANLSLVKNPRELIENNIGGVINVTDVSAVMPLPTPQLSPASFSTDEMFAKEKESRSGVSRIGQGIDPNALNGNNSARLIETLGAFGNRRIMTMARHFAEMTLRPLLAEVYRLAVKYETKPQTLQISGRFEQITPKDLGDRSDMTVRVALTPDESKAQAQAMVAVHQLLSDQPIYGIKQKHALLSEVAGRLGISQTSAYMMSPEDPEFAQMMQQQAQQAQQQSQQQMAIVQAQAQFKQQEIEIERQKVQQDYQLKVAELERKMQAFEREIALKSSAEAHDQRVDIAKLNGAG